MRPLSLFFILTLTLASPIFAQQISIGVVNSEVLAQNYPQFREAEAQLGREMESMVTERKSWEADMQRLQETIEGKRRNLEAGQYTFTESKKTKMKTEIDSLQSDFQRRVNQQMAYEQERIETRRAELISNVLEIINEEIEELGDQSDYDLIIDSSNGTVVYAKNPDDLTDQLLRNLQEK